MQINEWSVFLLLLKLTSYFAIASLAGTLLMRVLNSKTDNVMIISFYRYLKGWQLVFLTLGCAASLLQVPIEAGAIAESGLAGMVDPFMLEIVWQSVIGEQAVIRVPAFIVAIIAVASWQTHHSASSTIKLNFLILLLMLAFITYSFTFTGHSANETILIKSTFVLHLIAIASWLGSLWPLYKSCQLLPLQTVKRLMHRFGQFAIVIIAVLLISGSTLLLAYLNTWAELFTSNYGQLILLKLLLVSAMLLLGAWHKLFLVPQIEQPHHILTLKRSISVEMLIALFVLLTTSIFTTLIGPPM
ncbi:MAG: copper resistance D family protein [Thalassotalea sp.]